MWAATIYAAKIPPNEDFSLEYIRQMNNMDEVHFFAAKKKSQFKIKTQVGPLIWNSKAAGQEVNKILREI